MTAVLARKELSPVYLEYRGYAWRALGETGKGDADLQRARELRSDPHAVKDTTDSKEAAPPDNDG